MDFSEYQKKASLTAIYPNIGRNFIYPTLGLVGEAGEIANKIKKVILDNNYELSEERNRRCHLVYSCAMHRTKSRNG